MVRLLPVTATLVTSAAANVSGVPSTVRAIEEPLLTIETVFPATTTCGGCEIEPGVLVLEVVGGVVVAGVVVAGAVVAVAAVGLLAGVVVAVVAGSEFVAGGWELGTSLFEFALSGSAAVVGGGEVEGPVLGYAPVESVVGAAVG
jgi:hypothetical protein